MGGGGGGREREPGSTTPVHLQSLVLLKTEGERAKVSDPCSSSLVGSFENTPSVLLLLFFFSFFFFLSSSLFCFAFVFGSNSESTLIILSVLCGKCGWPYLCKAQQV